MTGSPYNRITSKEGVQFALQLTEDGVSIGCTRFISDRVPVASAINSPKGALQLNVVGDNSEKQSVFSVSLYPRGKSEIPPQYLDHIGATLGRVNLSFQGVDVSITNLGRPDEQRGTFFISPKLPR